MALLPHILVDPHPWSGSAACMDADFMQGPPTNVHPQCGDTVQVDGRPVRVTEIRGDVDGYTGRVRRVTMEGIFLDSPQPSRIPILGVTCDAVDSQIHAAEQLPVLVLQDIVLRKLRERRRQRRAV